MFCKGDKIVYPMYGAGIIEEMQNKIIDGKVNPYYIMNLPIGNLKIMVSVYNAENLGLRQVYTKDDVLKIINSTAQIKPINTPENWNQRYKENMSKIKSGKLVEVLDVYRNLSLREREKGLSSAEKKMLTTVKQIIISEIILTQDLDKAKAEELLEDSLNIIYESFSTNISL